MILGETPIDPILIILTVISFELINLISFTIFVFSLLSRISFFESSFTFLQWYPDEFSSMVNFKGSTSMDFGYHSPSSV